jgi:hypothetical protein
MGDRAHGKAVIPGDLAFGAHHVGARCAAFLVLESAAAQPLVKRGFAGIEAAQARAAPP